MPLGTALKANAVFEGLDTVGTSFWAPRSRQQAQSLRAVFGFQQNADVAPQGFDQAASCPQTHHQ